MNKKHSLLSVFCLVLSGKTFMRKLKVVLQTKKLSKEMVYRVCLKYKEGRKGAIKKVKEEDPMLMVSSVVFFILAILVWPSAIWFTYNHDISWINFIAWCAAIAQTICFFFCFYILWDELLRATKQHREKFITDIDQHIKDLS